MRVMKVREFTYPTYVGGIETCLKELCPALSSLGVKVFLLTCAERGLPSREVQDDVEIRRLDFLGIKFLTPILKMCGVLFGIIVRALFFLALIPHSIRLIKEKRIEILHVHCLSPISAFTVALVGWLMKIPVLLTLHGSFFRVYGDVLPFPLSWLVPSLEKAFLNHGYYTKILVEDEYTMRILLELGVPEEKVEILLYPGVNVEKLSIRSGSEKISERKVILHHGRLVRKRGIDYLIKALPNVVKRLPGVKVVIAGEGPEKERLVKLARNLGVLDYINFMGIVPHEEIPRLIKIADVIVIPSLVEGHSTSLIEAMAAGKPVVATRVGGIVEVIIDGENGLLVEPKNPKQISDAVIRILTDPELGIRLGHKARETARKFDVKHLAEQELSIFEEVVSR